MFAVFFLLSLHSSMGQGDILECIHVEELDYKQVTKILQNHQLPIEMFNVNFDNLIGVNKFFGIYNTQWGKTIQVLVHNAHDEIIAEQFSFQRRVFKQLQQTNFFPYRVKCLVDDMWKYFTFEPLFDGAQSAMDFSALRLKIAQRSLLSMIKVLKQLDEAGGVLMSAERAIFHNAKHPQLHPLSLESVCRIGQTCYALPATTQLARELLGATSQPVSNMENDKYYLVQARRHWNAHLFLVAMKTDMRWGRNDSLAEAVRKEVKKALAKAESAGEEPFKWDVVEKTIRAFKREAASDSSSDEGSGSRSRSLSRSPSPLPRAGRVVDFRRRSKQSPSFDAPKTSPIFSRKNATKL